MGIGGVVFGGIGLSIVWFGALDFIVTDLAGLTTSGMVLGGMIFGIIAF